MIDGVEHSHAWSISNGKKMNIWKSPDSADASLIQEIHLRNM